MVDFGRLPNVTDHDILLLKVFDAVVKAGSFAAAEISLNKSKSAISVYISSLEDRLGQTLCQRGRAGFSLTPEGQKIYEICEELFADLDRFRERVSKVTTLSGGVLSIVIDDSLFGHHEALSGALANFKNAYADVFLILHVSSPERVMQMLLDTSVDIGVSAIPREVPGTEIHALHEEELALYCGSDHPLFTLADEEITAEILADCEFVDLGSYQQSDSADLSDRLRTMARSGHATSRLLLILTGRMAGLLPREFAKRWVNRGRLREIRINELSVPQRFFLIVRNEVGASKVHKRLLDEFKRAFRDI